MVGDTSGVLVGLNHPDAQNPSRVGNKFSGLARLHVSGIAVPIAFSIPSEIVEELLRGDREARVLLDSVIAEASTVLRIAQGIAVRSSGLDEDLPGESGAGRFKTFLSVTDVVALRKAIGEVLSHYSETHLARVSASHRFSVILQRMVFPSVAGVAFSRHPLREEEDLVVIEAVEGLADQLVSGKAEPIRIVSPPIHDPEIALSADSSRLLLESSQLLDLRKKVRIVEHLWGCPVDVEWAIEEKRLFFLQARPATGMGSGRPSGTWTRGIAEDLWGDPLCPLDASILEKMSHRFDLRGHARRLGISVDETAPNIAVIAGYLYVNADLLASVLRSLPAGLNMDFAKRLFPPESVLMPEGKWLPFLARATWLLMFEPQSNPIMCVYLTRRKIRQILKSLNSKRWRTAETLDLTSLANELRSLQDLLGDLLACNRMPYLYAFLLTSVIDQGLRRRGLSGSGVALLSGCRTNPTYQMHARLLELGMFLKRQYGDKMSDVSPSTETTQMVDRFLDDFGCRSDSRSLREQRWAEDRQKVISMARAIAIEPIFRPTNSTASQFSFTLRVLSAIARKYLELREELRDVLDRLLWAQRIVLLRMDHLLGLQGTVFDLPLEQLFLLAESKEHAVEAANLPVCLRLTHRQRRGIPPRFFTNGKALELHISGVCWEGIPTSVGRTTGRCRKVSSVADALAAGEGEILIAASMGPTWTPILPRVSGVILSEGSMLDHFSILARECRIPCIVGAGRAVLDIPDGTVITMDGYEGTISIT